MKTQKSNRQMYCPAAALRYARVLFELQVSEEAVETAKAMFEEVQIGRASCRERV